jgi:hypothetical protein
MRICGETIPPVQAVHWTVQGYVVTMQQYSSIAWQAELHILNDSLAPAAH